MSRNVNVVHGKKALYVFNVHEYYNRFLRIRSPPVTIRHRREHNNREERPSRYYFVVALEPYICLTGQYYYIDVIVQYIILFSV